MVKKIGFFRRFEKKSEEVCVNKDKKWSKKEVNAFDIWAKKNKKLILRNDEKLILDACWYEDLLSAVKKNKNIEKFLENKNRELRKEFIDDVIPVHIEVMVSCFEEINKCENVISFVDNITDEMVQFEKMVVKLVSGYPQKREEDIKSLLADYMNSGRFLESNIEHLRFETVGFVKNVIYFVKKIIVNRRLNKFVKNWEEKNIFSMINELYRKPYGIDFWHMLSCRLGVICNLDFDNSVKWETKINKRVEKMKRFIVNEEKLAEKKKNVIENIEKSFDTAELLEKEKIIILEYIESYKITTNR